VLVLVLVVHEQLVQLLVVHGQLVQVHGQVLLWPANEVLLFVGGQIFTIMFFSDGVSASIFREAYKLETLRQDLKDSQIVLAFCGY
jgi:hypothetical protein